MQARMAIPAEVLATAVVATALAPLLVVIALASAATLVVVAVLRAAGVLWGELQQPRPSVQLPSRPAMRMPAWIP